MHYEYVLVMGVAKKKISYINNFGCPYESHIFTVIQRTERCLIILSFFPCLL